MMVADFTIQTNDPLRPNIRLALRGLVKGFFKLEPERAVLVGPLGGYLTPDLKGAGKIFLGLMGVGKIKYSEDRSGAIVFAPGADKQTIRDAVDRCKRIRHLFPYGAQACSGS